MLAVPQLLSLMRFILSLLLHVSLGPLENFISKQNDKIQLYESLVTIYINLHYACNLQKITCSKSVIETVEKDVKYVQS